MPVLRRHELLALLLLHFTKCPTTSSTTRRTRPPARLNCVAPEDLRPHGLGALTKVRLPHAGGDHPLRRCLGVDDAQHVVHRRRDVLRRLQAAPFLHLEAEGVERHRVERGDDVEVQHGEPERLHPRQQLEQLPRPPRRHHAEAGVRVHHDAHLHVRRRGGAARLLRAAAGLHAHAVLIPRRRVAPHVLRVPEEPRERGRRLLASCRCRGLLGGHGAAAVARRITSWRRRRVVALCRRVFAASLLRHLQRALLRLEGLQLLLELLHEIDGAADDGRLVAPVDVRLRHERPEHGEVLVHLAPAVALDGNVGHPLALQVLPVLHAPHPPPPLPPPLLHPALPLRLRHLRRRRHRRRIAEEAEAPARGGGARGGGVEGVVDEDVAAGRAQSLQRHVDAPAGL
uniref:Uncharacterized protein n=1 Tax=Arundo donax TaxID=35708 RepID=A0A0A9DE44_ARUDO